MNSGHWAIKWHYIFSHGYSCIILIFCPQFYSFMMVLGWGLRFGFLVRLFSWGFGPVCGAFLVFVGLGP